MHRMLKSMVSFYKAKAFSVVFEEWLSREEQLSVNDVILHSDRDYIGGFQLERAMSVHFHIELGTSFLGFFFVLSALFSDLGVKRARTRIDSNHLLLVVELAIVLIKLIGYDEEHHSPGADRIVVIFLHDAPCNFKVIAFSLKEIKISLQVIVLDPKCLVIIIRCLQLIKQVDGFLHTVL